MNIGYRIVKVDPSEHGILVRYFTDKVTEMDLATSLNQDGTVKVNADGYPLSTRTDMFMSIYQFPTPTFAQIEKDIMLRAPVDWLRLQENVKDKAVDTTLSELKNHVGDTATFTTDTIDTLRNEIYTIASSNTAAGIEAANVVVTYANSDPVVASAFANVVIQAIHAGTTIPL